MPGFQEHIIKLAPILIGVAILLAGVARLRKKLAKDANPTMGTYVNELGGYIVAAIIALILGIYLLFFDSGAAQSSSVDSDHTRKVAQSAESPIKIASSDSNELRRRPQL